MIDVGRAVRVAERSREQEPVTVGVPRDLGIDALGRLAPGDGESGHRTDGVRGEQGRCGHEFFRALAVRQPAGESPQPGPVLASRGEVGGHRVDRLAGQCRQPAGWARAPGRSSDPRLEFVARQLAGEVFDVEQARRPPGRAGLSQDRLVRLRPPGPGRTAAGLGDPVLGPASGGPGPPSCWARRCGLPLSPRPGRRRSGLRFLEATPGSLVSQPPGRCRCVLCGTSPDQRLALTPPDR